MAGDDKLDGLGERPVASGDFGLPFVLPVVRDEHLRFRKYLNLLVSLLERKRRATMVAGTPCQLTIDATTACQLSCPYCATGAGLLERPAAVLRPGLHRRLLQEFGADAFIVQYFSNGEPLLHKGLAELVRDARRYELFSIISTNLSLPLNDARLKELLECGLGVISASIDGTTADTYIRYRVGGDFELAMGNLRRLVEKKRELGLEYPLIQWRYLVFEHNEHQVEDAMAMALELGVDLLEFHPGSVFPDAPPDHVQAARGECPLARGKALTRALGREETRLQRMLMGNSSMGHADAPGVLGRKCDWLYLGAMLYPDGAVGPCCVTGNSGDDFGKWESERGLRDIWNNSSFQGARALFNGDGDESLVCGHCPLPPVQDLYFQHTLRGLLRNAPDWVLLALGRAPGLFFYEVDRLSMPAEYAAIGEAARRLADLPVKPVASVGEALRNAARGSSAKAQWVRLIVSLLS